MVQRHLQPPAQLLHALVLGRAPAIRHQNEGDTVLLEVGESFDSSRERTRMAEEDAVDATEALAAATISLWAGVVYSKAKAKLAALLRGELWENRRRRARWQREV
jgi:hypothetical protein